MLGTLVKFRRASPGWQSFSPTLPVAGLGATYHNSRSTCEPETAHLTHETLRPDALSEAIISAHFSCRRGSGKTGLQSDVP